MPTFPSVEWIDAFCDNLSRHPQARQTAAALEGSYRFVVEPAGPLSERRSYDMHIQPAPDGATVTRLDVPDGDPRLTLSADYVRWRELITGQLDMGFALMLRRLRVSGDLAGIRGQLSNAGPLVDALRGVDSQWLDA